MRNERKTEAFVRQHFMSDPYSSTVIIEEQKSASNPRINECLTKASKHGNGVGMPDFIITFPTNAQYVIVVECKADIADHESPNHDKLARYAVDGVLHYAKALHQMFNVIAIAVSGTPEQTILVTNFIWKMSEAQPTRLAEDRLLSIGEYMQLWNDASLEQTTNAIDLVNKAVQLNQLFQDCAVSENARVILVSAVLLALQDPMFRSGYLNAQTPDGLIKSMLLSVESVLHNAKLNQTTIDTMMNVFRQIENEPIAKNTQIRRDKTMVNTVNVLKYDIIDYIDRNVGHLFTSHDVLGRFYTEFLKYAGSKQKQGIVLTPIHICELACDLTNIQPTDVVLDPCCGTGGFLISALQRMSAYNNGECKIVGVERDPQMFTIAVVNTLLRGHPIDGLIEGDCFNSDVVEQVREFSPTVGLLNPPYDQGTDVQLEFVKHALDMVQPGGRVAALVQMSCAISQDKRTVALRQQLLTHNTLEAVISLPDDLFYPVGVVTCLMVFKAGVPYSGKTWFGYMKDDGFVKRKNQGRIDVYNKWPSIKQQLLDAFTNKDELPGLCVKHNVSARDEWCAEAYMETDYSVITAADYERELKRYSIWKLTGGEI